MGPVGSTLASYLTPAIDAGRTDIGRDPHALRRGLAPDLVPPARWPAAADRALVTHQQFAANHALASLTDGRGIVAVNGPPGTGKTTLLRDLVAGIVVERARRLAHLDKPYDAFVGTDRYSTERRGTKEIHFWHPDLTGHEIVVASSNNGAVDNVVNEIPATGAVANEWADRADHFADIATDLLMGRRRDVRGGHQRRDRGTQSLGSSGGANRVRGTRLCGPGVPRSSAGPHIRRPGSEQDGAGRAVPRRQA